MKKFDVVCHMGAHIQMVRVVEATNEEEAKQLMVDEFMSPTEKQNCINVEVFESVQ